MSKWDDRFIDLAAHISNWSKDPTTKVGCIVVGPNKEIRSTGYNGFPSGVEDTEERLNNRPRKHELVVHAEQNAVAFAALNGVSLKGCSVYVTHAPCTSCAKSLIQAGITKVKYKYLAEGWEGGIDILREAGIIVNEI